MIHACFFVHRDIKPGNVGMLIRFLTSWFVRWPSEEETVGGSTYSISDWLDVLYNENMEKPTNWTSDQNGRGLLSGGRITTAVSISIDLKTQDDETICGKTFFTVTSYAYIYRAFMYTLIEFKTGILPWEHERDKQKIEKIKQKTPISILLQVIFIQVLDVLMCSGLPSNV